MDIEIKELADKLEVDISHACQVYHKLTENIESNCPRCGKLHMLNKLNYKIV